MRAVDRGRQGSGQVHNADYSLATAARPLERSEYAFLYLSGLGAVTNGVAVADVRVTLGGLSCDVQFAGMAPGFPGVYQVNFRVPSSAASGLQDIVVTASGVVSPTVRANLR
jgi:minor extracellular serine protease Vpr